MPKTTDSSENPFKCGAQVEMSFEEEGFRGSWYSATVIRLLPKRTHKKPRILLQFHTLTATADEDITQPLREAVDLILVHPIPPRESRHLFHVGEDVDTFHNDGWWEGIVISVLDGGKNYSVFFRSSHEQLVFLESLLRLHHEWVYGEWVPRLEDNAKDNEIHLPQKT